MSDVKRCDKDTSKDDMSKTVRFKSALLNRPIELPNFLETAI
ncbi:MAG: hypothetical protein ACRC10_10145 [Thermoguttaceae bacterium]